MVSTLKQITLKHEFTPKIEVCPTQTKEKRNMPPTITTATDMHKPKPETSLIDLVIENNAEGKEHSAVYIRPPHIDISYILKATKAKNKESKTKYINVIELKDKFCGAMPQYYDSSVFNGLIFWFAYPKTLYDPLKTAVGTI